MEVQGWICDRCDVINMGVVHCQNCGYYFVNFGAGYARRHKYKKGYFTAKQLSHILNTSETRVRQRIKNNSLE